MVFIKSLLYGKIISHGYFTKVAKVAMDAMMMSMNTMIVAIAVEQMNGFILNSMQLL